MNPIRRIRNYVLLVLARLHLMLCNEYQYDGDSITDEAALFVEVGGFDEAKRLLRIAKRQYAKARKHTNRAGRYISLASN